MENAYQQTELVVNRTFLVLRRVDAEASSKKRRRKSDSAFVFGGMGLGELKCEEKENVPLSQKDNAAKQADKGIRVGARADFVQSCVSPPSTVAETGTVAYCNLGSSPQSCAGIELRALARREGITAETSTFPETSEEQDKVQPSDGDEAIDGAADAADAHNTTLMLRDLPADLSQSGLVAHLTEAGYCGQFDFVYMPLNFRNGCNVGYAFVNFVSNHAAVLLMQSCAGHGSELPSSLGTPACSWSSCQGFAANVDRYRNSPLMHESVPKDCKPAAYDSSGNRALFPEPTETISKPRARILSQIRAKTKPEGKILEA